MRAGGGAGAVSTGSWEIRLCIVQVGARPCCLLPCLTRIMTPAAIKCSDCTELWLVIIQLRYSWGRQKWERWDQRMWSCACVTFYRITLSHKLSKMPPQTLGTTLGDPECELGTLRSFTPSHPHTALVRAVDCVEMRGCSGLRLLSTQSSPVSVLAVCIQSDCQYKWWPTQTWFYILTCLATLPLSPRNIFLLWIDGGKLNLKILGYLQLTTVSRWLYLIVAPWGPLATSHSYPLLGRSIPGTPRPPPSCANYLIT